MNKWKIMIAKYSYSKNFDMVMLWMLQQKTNTLWTKAIVAYI